MTLSTAASGAGSTGTFVFLVNSTPPVDMMSSSYPFPSYTDGQQVSVVINNIRADIMYSFTVSAKNMHGTSDFTTATWISNGECLMIRLYMCCLPFTTATTQPQLPITGNAVSEQ